MTGAFKIWWHLFIGDKHSLSHIAQLLPSACSLASLSACFNSCLLAGVCVCVWVHRYQGPTLFEALDAINDVDRNPLAPLRLPIVDKWRDMGTIIMGKIESGFLRVGDVVQLMPNK